MAQLPVAVIESIAAHHGVIDRASFVEHGVSLHQIDRRIESGRLIRMHDGVYRSGEWPDSERARCVAACLAATDGAISHSGDRASVDKRRDRRVRLAGFETVRVSDDDLARRLGETVDHLVRIYRLRSRPVVGEVDATVR